MIESPIYTVRDLQYDIDGNKAILDGEDNMIDR